MGGAMRKLRVLALVHPDLVPPDSLSGYSAEEINRWKTEYNVVQTLRKLGHEVRVLGVQYELMPIREAVEEWDPHIVFNLLEEVEDDVRVPLLHRLPDGHQLVLHAEHPDLVPQLAKRLDDVVLGLPPVDLLRRVPGQRVWRHQVRMHERKDAQLPHSATHRRWLCRKCIVFTVSMSAASIRSRRSDPTARSLSSRQRPIMSARTWSTVN